MDLEDLISENSNLPEKTPNVIDSFDSYASMRQKIKEFEDKKPYPSVDQVYVN